MGACVQLATVMNDDDYHVNYLHKFSEDLRLRLLASRTFVTLCACMQQPIVGMHLFYCAAVHSETCEKVYTRVKKREYSA